MAKKKDSAKGNEGKRPASTRTSGISSTHVLVAIGIIIAAAVLAWVSARDPTSLGESGWALDPDSSVLNKFLAAPCTIKRVDATSFGSKFSANWKEPVILTNPKGGCGTRCSQEWRRDSFVSRFGHLPMAMSSQLGVAYFGPNTDDGHRHGWPQSLAEAVAEMENATAEAASTGKRQRDGRDNPFAFDGSDTLLKEIVNGTTGWEGSAGNWWPDQFAEITGRPILSMGPSRAGLPFHDHEATFLWLVHGYKHWFLLPPGTPPDGVPKAGQGHTTWNWLTSNSSELELPSATGDLGAMLQCTQKPGEVLFVPKRWQHATVNIGIALAYGGQGPRYIKPRSIADIDADLAASPKTTALYLEKARGLSDAKAKLKVLQAAYKVEPTNYEVWINLIEHLSQQGAVKAVSDMADKIWEHLAKLEDSGALSTKQVSVVLGHISGPLIETQKIHPEGLGVAVSLLQKAIKRDATNDYAVFYLGAAHMISGDAARAAKFFSDCLKLKPNHQKAAMALQMMKGQQR